MLQAMPFVFAMKATRTMHPTTSGSISTQTMCIMSVGVRPTSDHLFLLNVSRISFLCTSAIDCNRLIVDIRKAALTYLLLIMKHRPQTICHPHLAFCSCCMWTLLSTFHSSFLFSVCPPFVVFFLCQLQYQPSLWLSLLNVCPKQFFFVAGPARVGSSSP